MLANQTGGISETQAHTARLDYDQYSHRSVLELEALMSALRALWKIAGFREALRVLLKLDESMMEKVVAASEARLGPISAVGTADERAGTLATAAAALETLTRIRDEDGMDDLMADADYLLSDIPNAHKRLSGLLRESPDEAEQRVISRAQHAALPVLVRLSLEVDFRAVALPDSTTRFVPVTIARLEFDEPIGGFEAITFQLTDDRLEDVDRVAQKAVDLRRQIMDALPKEMLATELDNPSRPHEELQ
ncbi:hypothetical protein WEI85_00635 [Actinomycetes bacterium KLBMP 9797]